MPEVRVDPIVMPTGYKVEPEITIYLVRNGDQTMLVDTSTAFKNHEQILKQHLADLKVERLDWLLLTHCHNDHCGNARRVVEWFPEAKVIMHRLGAERLAKTRWILEHEDAQRNLLTWFGNPKDPDIPLHPSSGEERPRYLSMNVESDLDEDQEFEGFQAVCTPGHSMDHVCFGIGEHFFGGDTVLAFIPGMEAMWAGYTDAMDAFLESSKKLCLLSERYRKVHTFHGGGVRSLEEWYVKMVRPRTLAKAERLLKNLSRTQAKSLYQVMLEVHPQYPEHYVYITQYMGLLEMLVEHQQLHRVELPTGAYGYTTHAGTDLAWMEERLAL